MWDKSRPVVIANDHHCFGCGKLNAHGLRLSFYEHVEGNGVWTLWTPDAAFEGYGGIIHGGIICTILDEVMAWSLYRIDTWAVTGQMTTRFRKPIVLGDPVRAVGLILNDRGRIIEMRGEIRRASDDGLLAEASATFMRVPPDQADEWRGRYLGETPSSIREGAVQ